MMGEDGTVGLGRYMKGLLAVQVRLLEKAGIEEKPEVLLSSVGIPAKEIAEIVGKNPDAVAKAIQRANKKQK
jgi:DNA-directed RNA polymerase specialized sigma24 family protein